MRICDICWEASPTLRNARPTHVRVDVSIPNALKSKTWDVCVEHVTEGLSKKILDFAPPTQQED